jgi:polyribonucleotide nucleotidyltransferase
MTMFNKVTKTFQWGQHTVTMETGEIARQASGAVLVNIDDTVVLATVVGSKIAKAGQDFFPLTVDYIEKTYAAGKIPGSFFKREAKPSELETLTSRLIDRPIRPLFPEGFYNDVHVVIHTISLNPEVDADIAAMIATPPRWRVGHPVQRPDRRRPRGLHQRRIRAEPRPDPAQGFADGSGRGRHRSRRADGGIRSPATAEEVMLGAVVFGHEQGKIAINAIHELVREGGKPAWDWTAPAKDEALIAKVAELGEAKLRAAYQIATSRPVRRPAAAYADVKAA